MCLWTQTCKLRLLCEQIAKPRVGSLHMVGVLFYKAQKQDGSHLRLRNLSGGAAWPEDVPHVFPKQLHPLHLPH